MPVRLWLTCPADVMPPMLARLQWLGVRRLQRYLYGPLCRVSALLPDTTDTPLRVHWLWEQGRQQGLTVYLYAGNDTDLPFALPFLPPLRTERGVFGSIRHPTTQLCLALLQAVGLDAKRVLDIGTGTGVLAVAALAGGARQVIATDIASTAARLAAFNLARYPSERWAVVVCDLASALRGCFDLVCCNISADALPPLLSHLQHDLACDALIVSGFTAPEWRSVRRWLRSRGWCVDQWRFLNGWLAAFARRL